MLFASRILITATLVAPGGGLANSMASLYISINPTYSQMNQPSNADETSKIKSEPTLVL